MKSKGEGMTVSVCMGTYNGESYIEEQLYSIFNQTQKPDEVVICDDCSSDKTVEIIKHFIDIHELKDSWVLYENQENKGYPANFYYAMEKCSGDIVLLSDQDDIWHPEKIDQMCRAMTAQKEAKAICCKFGLVNGSGEDINTIMAPTHNGATGKLRQVTIQDVFYKCEWPGMVLCYRREWYGEWKKQSYQIPHDFLICAKAAQENGFYQLDQELAYHRRHENNAGGEEHKLKKLLNKDRKRKEIQDYLCILESFVKEEVMETLEGKQTLQEKVASMQGRYEALCSGKIGKVIKNGWKHRKNTRAATVICDVMIVRSRG